MVTLLGNFPHSYSTLVSALEACPNDTLKLAQVQQALVQEDIKLTSRLKQDTDVTGDPSSSLWWERREAGRPQKPTCHSCGQTCHFRQERITA